MKYITTPLLHVHKGAATCSLSCTSQYPGAYFLSNPCRQTTGKYISWNIHLSRHSLSCMNYYMQLTPLRVTACFARHCTHHTSRATKGGVRVDTQSISQLQTSGHRHKSLGIVLDIAILGCFGPPATISFKKAIRHTSIGCCCCTTCSQAMESKLPSIITKLPQFRHEQLTHACVTQASCRSEPLTILSMRDAPKP